MAEAMRPSSVRRIEELARRARVSVEILPKVALDKLAGKLNHQGVIAITGAFPYLDIENLLTAVQDHPNPLVVALDQVQDPRNLGAVIRSVHAFGANGLILTKDRSASITAAAVRTSAGASELIKVARVTNLVRALDLLRNDGYQVYGAAVGKDHTTLHRLDWTGKTVLILGNEERGLRRLTMEHCDRLFTIPMVSDFDSLNVSAAAAIALYETSKQRYPQGDEG